MSLILLKKIDPIPTKPTLVNQIAKLKQTNKKFKYSSPHHVLYHALFVINHLNIDTHRQMAMTRHWTPEGAMTRPLVK